MKQLTKNSPLVPMWLKQTLLVIVLGTGEVFHKRIKPAVQRHLKNSYADWDEELPCRFQVIGIDRDEDRRENFEDVGDENSVSFVRSGGSIPWQDVNGELPNPLHVFLVCTPDHLHVENILEIASTHPSAVIAVEKPILNSAADAESLRSLLASPNFTGTLLALEHYIAKESFVELLSRIGSATNVTEMRVAICESDGTEDRPDCSHAYLDLGIHVLLMGIRIFRELHPACGRIRAIAYTPVTGTHPSGYGTIAEGRFTLMDVHGNSLKLTFVTGKLTTDLKTLRLMAGDIELDAIWFSKDDSNAHELMVDAVLAGGSPDVLIDTMDAIDACEAIARVHQQRDVSAEKEYTSSWPFALRRTAFEPFIK